MVALEVLGLLLRFVTQIVLARSAGAEEFGLYTLSFTWAQLLAILAGLGLSSAVIRFVPAYRAAADWRRLRGLVRRTSQITVLSGTVVATAGAAVVLLLGLRAEVQHSVLLGLVAVPLLALTLLQAELLRGGGRLFAARVMPTVVQPLLVLGLCLAVAAGRGPLTGTAILTCVIVAALVTVLLLQGALRRPLGPGDESPEPLFDTRTWISVALPLLLVKGFQVVLNLSDIILVGLLAGTTEAGLYAVAVRTAALAGFFFTAINLAMSPSISYAHARGDSADVQRQLRLGARLAFWPSLGLTLGLVLLRDDVLTAFGPAFAAAGGCLAVLVVGRLANAVTGPVGTVLSVTGHERTAAVVYGLAAVSQVLLDLALIPPLGIVGAALASSLVTVGWNIALFRLVMIRLDLRLWPLALPQGGAS